MQKGFWERPALKKRRSASHPVVLMYSQSKLNLIFQKIEYKAVNNILDIGCGNGFFTVPLYQRFRYVIGLDFSSLMLSLITKDRMSLLKADSLFLPFKDYSFDLVFSSNLLHHVDNVTTSIREMKRVSKRYIIIIEANRLNILMYLFSKLKREEDEDKIFTLENLKAKVSQENILILDAFSTGLITPNRTPYFLTPFLRTLNTKKNRFGLYNVIIGLIEESL